MYKRLNDGQHWFYWFTPHVPLSLLQWYSLCISYDAATDKLVAFLNGHKIADFVNKNYKEKALVRIYILMILTILRYRVIYSDTKYFIVPTYGRLPFLSMRRFQLL